MAEKINSGKAAFAATTGGLFAILLWSFTIAFTRSISEHLGTVYGAGYVYLISAVLGLINVLRSSKQRSKLSNLPHRYLWGCGSLFLGYMLCLFLAVGMAENRSQSLEIGLINYLWPALILLFSVPILKIKPVGCSCPALLWPCSQPFPGGFTPISPENGWARIRPGALCPFFWLPPRSLCFA